MKTAIVGIKRWTIGLTAFSNSNSLKFGFSIIFLVHTHNEILLQKVKILNPKT